MSDSLGLLNFAIGLVNSVINLPDGQVKFFEEFRLQENCEINLLIKPFLGPVEMMFGLVNVSFSLTKWQAVKMTFFAPRVAFTEKESFYSILVSPLYIRQVQKSDRINSDHQSGSDQLGSTRTNSDRIKNKNKIKLDSDQLGL